MSSDWSETQTGTHQDHVIAHVIGTTVLGHFVWDEIAYLLLDIGFIWMIYLDGGMGLVPQSLAITELELSDGFKAELLSDIQSLHEPVTDAQPLTRLTVAPHECLINRVNIYARDQQRSVRVWCEATGLNIETSLDTGEIRVRAISTEAA